MPYIKSEDKKKFHSFENVLNEIRIGVAGELNYLITLLVQSYLHQNGHRYAKMNDVVGALECAKIEFYRRLAAPYEDKKIEENGDVY